MSFASQPSADVRSMGSNSTVEITENSGEADNAFTSLYVPLMVAIGGALLGILAGVITGKWIAAKFSHRLGRGRHYRNSSQARDGAVQLTSDSGVKAGEGPAGLSLVVEGPEAGPAGPGAVQASMEGLGPLGSPASYRRKSPKSKQDGKKTSIVASSYDWSTAEERSPDRESSFISRAAVPSSGEVGTMSSLEMAAMGRKWGGNPQASMQSSMVLQSMEDPGFMRGPIPEDAALFPGAPPSPGGGPQTPPGAALPYNMPAQRMPAGRLKPLGGMFDSP